MRELPDYDQLTASETGIVPWPMANIESVPRSQGKTRDFHFGVRLDGFMVVEQSGLRRFTLNAAGRLAKVWLDGKPFI